MLHLSSEEEGETTDHKPPVDARSKVLSYRFGSSNNLANICRLLSHFKLYLRLITTLKFFLGYQMRHILLTQTISKHFESNLAEGGR